MFFAGRENYWITSDLGDHLFACCFKIKGKGVYISDLLKSNFFKANPFSSGNVIFLNLDTRQSTGKSCSHDRANGDAYYYPQHSKRSCQSRSRCLVTISACTISSISIDLRNPLKWL